MKGAPSIISIAKTGFMGVTGLGYTVILPILIGAIVDQLGLDRSMVGWITFSNIGGLAIGGISATLLIGKIRLLHLIRFGCIGLIVFDLLSTACSSAEVLLAYRFLSGIAGGILYSSSLASFSALEDSIKAFSIYVISYAAVSSITLFGLPYLINLYGYEIGFYTLAFMALISLAFSSVILEFESGLKAKDFSSLTSLFRNKYVVMGLLSYFLTQLGGGVMYTYIERIAQDAGQSSELVGFILSISAIFSAIAAFVIIKMGNRFGQIWPMTIGLFLMTLSMITLFYAEYTVMFLIGSCLVGAFWSVMIPFYQQMQGRFDLLGRIVTVGTVLNMLGRAIGPALAALFLGDSAFENVLYLSIAALAVAYLLLVPIFMNEQESQVIS